MKSWLDYGVKMAVAGAAVSLPRDRSVELGPWAQNEARSRLGAGATEEQVATFAEALAGAAADSQTRNPIMAFSFCPDPEFGELARIEVRDLAPDETVPELTIPWLAERLGGRTPESLGPAEITHGDLPIGPAVRVHHQFAIKLNDEGESGALQTAAYATIPKGMDHAAILFVSWQALAWSEKLFGLVDQLAETLRVVPRDGH